MSRKYYSAAKKLQVIKVYETTFESHPMNTARHFNIYHILISRWIKNKQQLIEAGRSTKKIKKSICDLSNVRRQAV